MSVAPAEGDAGWRWERVVRTVPSLAGLLAAFAVGTIVGFLAGLGVEFYAVGGLAATLGYLLAPGSDNRHANA